MAGFGRRTSNYLVINMVYVPEDIRARGVATKMISEMSFLARRIGFRNVYSLVNKISQKIYIKIWGVG